MGPCLLILAAGAARRMRGGDKLAEPVAGLPLLTRLARAAVATGLPVTVVLPADDAARGALVAGLPVATVHAPPGGMAESLGAGLATLPPGAVMLLLADMPEIGTEDIALIAARHRAAPDAILRATAADGTPGHPVLFPGWLRDDLMRLSGDTGAKEILRRHPVVPVPLPGRRAVTDLDTPEDWAEWRRRTGDSTGDSTGDPAAD